MIWQSIKNTQLLATTQKYQKSSNSKFLDSSASKMYLFIYTFTF